MAQTIRVTLVHGTFARRAKWIQPESTLWATLTAAGMLCQKFTWSGCNSHRARSRATDALVACLETEARAYPDARQALVAHSHGGNLAVRAAQRIHESSDRDIQVVTLATPFIYAAKARFPRSVMYVAAGNAFILLIVGFNEIFQGWEGGPGTPKVMFLVLSGLVLVHLVGFVYWSCAYGWPSTSRCDEFIDSIQCPKGGTSLLVVRAAVDEAGATLAFAQLASWLSATVLRLSRPRVWVPVYILLALSLNLLFIAGLEEEVSSVVIPTLYVTGLFALGLISIPALANAMAYGPDGVAGSFFAFVSAEATPPGRHAVRQRAITDAGNSGLAHSSLYNDEEVIEWVVEHLKNSPDR